MRDEQLVARAQGGDRDAFGELYRRHIERVHRYIRFRVVDESLAEDLSHDVFLAAWRALPGFSWQGDLRPWLLRAAHNRVANHWRTLGRRPTPEALDRGDDGGSLSAGGGGGGGSRSGGGESLGAGATLAADGEVPLDAVARALSMHDVERMLVRLSDAQRQVVALRFGLELSVAETADVMDRSLSAVKNLQYEALNRVRTLLLAENATRAEAASSARDDAGAVDHEPGARAGGADAAASNGLCRDVVVAASANGRAAPERNGNGRGAGHTIDSGRDGERDGGRDGGRDDRRVPDTRKAAWSAAGRPSDAGWGN